MIKYEKLSSEVARIQMRRYVEEGVPPSHFFKAVLENDLCEACFRADGININRLKEYAFFCYWELPSDIWGSKEKVRAHINSF